MSTQPPPGDPRGQNSAAAAPPRAFAQGTGVLLQTVGVMLFLSSCCACSLSGLWDQEITPAGDDAPVYAAPLARTIDNLAQHPDKLGLMIMVMFTTVGGFALAVFGLGLQSEKRRAAWGATAVAVALVVTQVVAGVALWLGGASVTVKLVNLALLVLLFVVTGFAIAALRQVLANPPPIDSDKLPPGYKVPYSWYHQDPPEVRLERELAQRRAKLEAQHRELDKIERELREKRQP